jgi:hypothetical protein
MMFVRTIVKERTFREASLPFLHCSKGIFLEQASDEQTVKPDEMFCDRTARMISLQTKAMYLVDFPFPFAFSFLFFSLAEGEK